MWRLRSAWGVLLFFLAVGVVAQKDEPYPPKGSYNHSLHRFFPDLDARLNAVRYGRWRAIEVAWVSGIDAGLDRECSRYLTRLIDDPPRFPPEADRVAPRFAREAAPIFRALRWGQVLEQQVLDILAAPDASPYADEERLTRLFGLYRRERWALSEPQTERLPVGAVRAAPASAHILQSGTRLFALAAEDLATGDFGSQRWLVKQTVEDFDRSFTIERSPEESRYRSAAPKVFSRFPQVADTLDRIAEFRGELFEALVSGGRSAEARRRRDDRVRQLAREWGLPVGGIGGR